MEILNHPRLQKYARICPAGFTIMTEGDQANSLYILTEGRLDVIKGGKKIHEINAPGSFFGELSFLLDTVRIASVIAASEDTRYLCLPNSEVNWIWQEFPEFARHLARNLAKRLYETTNVAQGFREFCDQMPDAVIMTNANYTVLSWNRAAEKLYGRSWSQMRGKSIEDIYDNQAAFKQFIAKLHSTEAIREKTLKISHPDKEWFFVSTSTTVLKDPNDNIQGYLFLGRDATSLQRLEEKQQRFRKWLLPVLLGLTLLTGWLGWRQLTTSPQTSYRSSATLTHEHIINRLNRDTTALELALRPAFKTSAAQTARMILADYFTVFQPELDGITGVLIMNDQKRILSNYLPAQPNNKELVGQTYRGIKFSENVAQVNKAMNIFMVSRPESVGGEGVEVVVTLRKQPASLAFRLDMGLIKDKFGCNINELAEAINQRNFGRQSTNRLPLKNGI
ncbi:MAG: cyclic nucleotide-binding domain-containing protein [Thermodesulfobacteriota bacterium]